MRVYFVRFHNSYKHGRLGFRGQALLSEDLCKTQQVRVGVGLPVCRDLFLCDAGIGGVVAQKRKRGGSGFEVRLQYCK